MKSNKFLRLLHTLLVVFTSPLSLRCKENPSNRFDSQIRFVSEKSIKIIQKCLFTLLQSEIHQILSMFVCMHKSKYKQRKAIQELGRKPKNTYMIWWFCSGTTVTMGRWIIRLGELLSPAEFNFSHIIFSLNFLINSWGIFALFILIILRFHCFSIFRESTLNVSSHFDFLSIHFLEMNSVHQKPSKWWWWMRKWLNWNHNSALITEKNLANEIEYCKIQRH